MITVRFSTWPNSSPAVGPCAKFHGDQILIIWIKSKHIFSKFVEKFQIWSTFVKQAPVSCWYHSRGSFSHSISHLPQRMAIQTQKFSEPEPLYGKGAQQISSYKTLLSFMMLYETEGIVSVMATMAPYPIKYYFIIIIIITYIILHYSIIDIAQQWLNCSVDCGIWPEISVCPPGYVEYNTANFNTSTKFLIARNDWAFPDCNSSLNSPMATKWCTKLEVA